MEWFFHTRRNFPPIHLNNSICTFVREVLKEIEDVKFPSGCDSINLDQLQKIAIGELMNLPNVIIKPSDKGGNVVLMDINQYRNICSKILINESWYRQISSTEVSSYKLEFLNLINMAKAIALIEKATWEIPQYKFPDYPVVLHVA